MEPSVAYVLVIALVITELHAICSVSKTTAPAWPAAEDDAPLARLLQRPHREASHVFGRFHNHGTPANVHWSS